MAVQATATSALSCARFDSMGMPAFFVHGYAPGVSQHRLNHGRSVRSRPADLSPFFAIVFEICRFDSHLRWARSRH